MINPLLLSLLLLALLISHAHSYDIKYHFTSPDAMSTFNKKFAENMALEFNVVTCSPPTEEEKPFILDRSTHYYNISPVVRRFYGSGEGSGVQVKFIAQSKERIKEGEKVWTFYAISIKGDHLIAKYSVKSNSKMASFQVFPSSTSYSTITVERIGSALRNFFTKSLQGLAVTEEERRRADGKKFF